MRINQYLARCGMGSRRQVEKLVEDGRVAVNQMLIADLALRVDPECDVVSVDNTIVRPRAEHAVWMFNKPLGLLCTREDPGGRPTIFEHLAHLPSPFQAVGRLDRDTSGLLLITNDGYLAQALMHPKFEVPRYYRVVVEGRWQHDYAERLKNGVEMREGGTGKADVLQVETLDGSRVQLQLCLKRGKKREIRYSLQALQLKVVTLQRTGLAHLQLGALEAGACRQLGAEELAQLYLLIPPPAVQK